MTSNSQTIWRCAAADKNAGLTLVCDGKVLLTYAAKPKHFTQTEAPTDWQEMGARLLRLGRPNTGMLFANVLAVLLLCRQGEGGRG
jgi:hypothetical protein